MGESVSIFPELHSINDLWPHVSHQPEIRREARSNGTTVLCYMIASADTFATMAARECRGVTFGADGRIAARPLHKFFNVGERPETMPGAIDWSSAVRVMDKRDGSLVHTVDMGGGNWDVKSKKSFDSHIAVASREYIAARPDYAELCKVSIAAGKTAIFEWTHPEHRIVIDYGRDAELQLLHVRDNVTGAYESRQSLKDAARMFRVPLVLEVTINGDPMEAAASAEGVEGWVLQFASGDMVKLKTRWYLDRHHTFTALRHRDVARAVITESIDDLKSKLTLGGVDIAPILAVEAEVLVATAAIRAEVDAMFKSTAGRPRKDIAIAFKNHRYFSLLMQAVSGRDPDVRTYFDRYILDEMFNLELVMRP